MNDIAAIKGCFSDFKIIKTRKLAQLIIEIPIEQADAALATLGGIPRSDSERWVALARLDLTASQQPLPHPREKRERLPFHELPMPVQAGIKSDDEGFALWMTENYPSTTEKTCAGAIRDYCCVESRADIQPGTVAGDLWIELLRQYERYR